MHRWSESERTSYHTPILEHLSDGLAAICVENAKSNCNQIIHVNTWKKLCLQGMWGWSESEGIYF